MTSEQCHQEFPIHSPWRSESRRAHRPLQSLKWRSHRYSRSTCLRIDFVYSAMPSSPYRSRGPLVRLLRLKTLADCLQQPQDNFLLLRFIAATAVIFGHSYALSGIPGARDFIARANMGSGIYTGSLAVDIFFVISGFLVTSSYVHRAQLEIFLKSRALRVLPAYAACMALTAYLLGAVYSDLPLWDYWTSPATGNYAIVNLQFGTDLLWNLPGVFVHNPYPAVVNGSIWTLPAEVRMYLWVAILGMLGVLRKRWLANCVFSTLFAVGLFRPDQLPLVPHPDFVRLAAFFLAGAFCYVNREWVPVNGWLLLVIFALALAVHRTATFPWALGALVTYASFWFAYCPNFHFFNRLGDYSYGLYLWGFPIGQAVAHWFGVPTRPLLIFVLSLPLTLFCAMLSWHIVEKPALSLKNRTLVVEHK
ncbi:MAG: acyltransferase [Rudaea sp.]|nr:acyltransferase [Rudaea sp.]